MKPAGHVRLSRDRRPDQTRPTTARTRCPQPAFGRTEATILLCAAYKPCARSEVPETFSGAQRCERRSHHEATNGSGTRWKTRLPWLTQRRIGCKAAPTPSSWSFTLGPNRLGTQHVTPRGWNDPRSTSDWCSRHGVDNKQHTEYSVGRRFRRPGWGWETTVWPARLATKTVGWTSKLTWCGMRMCAECLIPRHGMPSVLGRDHGGRATKSRVVGVQASPVETIIKDGSEGDRYFAELDAANPTILGGKPVEGNQPLVVLASRCIELPPGRSIWTPGLLAHTRSCAAPAASAG